MMTFITTVNKNSNKHTSVFFCGDLMEELDTDLPEWSAFWLSRLYETVSGTYPVEVVRYNDRQLIEGSILSALMTVWRSKNGELRGLIYSNTDIESLRYAGKMFGKDKL